MLLCQAWTVSVCAVRRYINFVCGRVRRMQTFIFGRNNGCMRNTWETSCKGSIRLAEPERGGTLLHTWPLFHKSFAPRTQWKSSNIRVSECVCVWGGRRGRRVPPREQSPAQQRYFRSIKSRWAQAESTSSPVSLRFEYWGLRAEIGSNLISFETRYSFA